MSICYDQSDPEQLWPCVGALTLEELDAEWLRCWRMLKISGDYFIKPNTMWWDHRLSDRVRGIEEALRSREFLHQEFQLCPSQARFACNGAGFADWCFVMFMKEKP